MIFVSDINGLVKFSPEQFTVNRVSTAMTGLSVIADILVVYALMRQSDIALDTYFIVSLTFGDLAFGILVLGINIVNGEICMFSLQTLSNTGYFYQYRDQNITVDGQ